jgi:ATP-dependent DNA ligase
MEHALMLATLTDRRDFGEGEWLLERKLDGERCLTRKDGGEVRLESRNGKDLTGTYPEVRGAVAATEAWRGGAERRFADACRAGWERLTAHEDGVLRYVGRVGTGYSTTTLHELVAQVGFAEWTIEGRLRQPRFLGLREDKRASEIVRERPQ